MSAAERFAIQAPARLQWHPAHGDWGADDPETFRLHVEFVHAHGVPAGQFTTFSTHAEAGPASHAGAAGASSK